MRGGLLVRCDWCNLTMPSRHGHVHGPARVCATCERKLRERERITDRRADLRDYAAAKKREREQREVSRHVIAWKEAA